MTTAEQTIRDGIAACEAAALAQGWADAEGDGGRYELTEGDCDSIVADVRRALGRGPTRQEWADAGLPHVGGAHCYEVEV